MRLEIKDIKKNDIFYECESGWNLQFLALTDPYREDEGWALKARGIRGETLFYVRDGYGHYGPKLYREPEYG